MTQSQTDEIGLKEIADLFWRKKWSILIITIVISGIGVSSLLFIPKRYTVKVILSPSTTDPAASKMNSMGSMAAQLGGLASLTGLGSMTNSTRSEAVATLQSEAITERYIKEHDLLPELYKKRWDSKNKAWKIDFFHPLPPTIWKANQFFEKEIRSVSDDTKTGMVTFKITWTDPKLAATWANELVRETNDYVRNKAIAESEKNIAYLRSQAATTDILEVRQAIYSLIETEINKEMVAQGSEEYAMKVIDPAVPPERATSPNVALWIIGSILAGISIAIAYVLAERTFAGSGAEQSKH